MQQQNMRRKYALLQYLKYNSAANEEGPNVAKYQKCMKSHAQSSLIVMFQTAQEGKSKEPIEQMVTRRSQVL